MSASGEFLIDAAVAVALTVGGVILLGVVVDDFVRDLGCDRVRPTHRPQRHRRHVGSPTV